MSQHPPRQSVPQTGFRLAVIGICLVVFVPIAWYGMGGEPDRWRAAALMEQYLDGDRQTAIAGMQQIVARRPDDQQMRITLARWLLDDDQAKQALELVEAVPAEARSRALLGVYQDCLQADGRSEESLAVFRELNPANLSRDRSATLQHLNALAYLQALSGLDLRLALKNSSRVVAEIGGQWNAELGVELSVAQQIALSAALVYRGSNGTPLAGQEIRSEEFRDELLAILDQAVRQAESEYSNARLLNNPLAIEFTRRLFGKDDEDEMAASDVDPDSSNSLVQTRSHALATMLTARALIWQDLGELENSFADRRRVLELNHDPAAIAAAWPPMSVLVNQLATLAMTLDTRGTVLYQLEKLQMAIGDLNSAVLAQECLVATGAAEMPGVVIATTDIRERREQVEFLPRKTLAVLLFHRSWILHGLGLEQAAIDDIRRVRELGFAPGSQLF